MSVYIVKRVGKTGVRHIVRYRRDVRTLNPAARIGTNTQVVVAQVVARLFRQHAPLPVGCWEAA